MSKIVVVEVLDVIGGIYVVDFVPVLGTHVETVFAVIIKIIHGWLATKPVRKLNLTDLPHQR
jgi:hypothetical protein